MIAKRREGEAGEGIRSNMHEPQTVTKKQLLASIEGSKGRRSIIAKELYLTLAELDELLKNYPDASIALIDELEMFIDEMMSQAHENLYKLLQEGDIRATIFVLETLGKDEGFVRRTEYSGPNGGPLVYAKHDPNSSS